VYGGRSEKAAAGAISAEVGMGVYVDICDGKGSWVVVAVVS